MCELCKLGQAGTAAGIAADEADREAQAAVGSALATNTRVARSNKDLLDLHGITAINLVSAPRAGETSLPESCIPTLRRDYRVGIVTTDLATEAEMLRMRALGVPTLQVVAGNGRHLDAHLLQRALDDLVSAQLDPLFIESDGNLACRRACASVSTTTSRWCQWPTAMIGRSASRTRRACATTESAVDRPAS